MKAWNWDTFAGSKAALKFNKRDLPNLERVIKMTPNRRVAVQAGGHLGLFPKRLAEFFKVVYTFEPASDLFAQMMQNAPESNILKFQAALGNERTLVGVRRIRRDGSTTPIHEGLTHIFGAGNIPTLQIDDLGLPICDLIQLDLEGWEMYALLGAKATIEKCRPILMIEVNVNQTYVNIEPEFLRDTIKGLGYRFVERMSSDDVFVPAEWASEAA